MPSRTLPSVINLPGPFLRWATLCCLVALAACQEPSGPPRADTAPVSISPDNAQLRYSGRFEDRGAEGVALGYSGARVRMRFVGRTLALRMADASTENYVKVWIDGEPQPKFRLDAPGGLYSLAEGLDSGEHTVEVVRLTECFLGLIQFQGFELDPSGEALPWPEAADRRIEFIGDSITCGYGVEASDPNARFEASTENFCDAYSGLTARQLKADYLVVARSGIGMVRNYNGPYEGSEETMPKIYPETFYQVEGAPWDFSRFVPQVVCINLGTNDFSTTGVNVETFVSTYIDFARGVLERYPDETQLVILQGPMNNDDALGGALARIVERLREEAPERVHFLELTAQGPLGFGASYHPNRAQSHLNADELTAYLAELMDWH